MIFLNKLKLLFIVSCALSTFTVAHSSDKITDYIEKHETKGDLKKKIADIDLKFSAGLVDFDLIQGINLSSRYRYEVESSYQDQFYNRIDKWDIKSTINVGDIVEDIISSPFSFSIQRTNSFIFVRQFKDKSEAFKALPYTPKRLPLTADAALENLSAGDFVSIPATLNLVLSANAGTESGTSIALSAGANVYWLISGEFTVQVFKIDDKKVRLKLISRAHTSAGTSAAAKVSFDVFGIRILDKQIERLLDRDLLSLGYSTTPGSQFIVDYIFDLSSTEGKNAYNQILQSTYKFKDVAVLKDLTDSNEIKDRLLTSYSLAENAFEVEKNKPVAEQKVTRLFKGFTKFKENTKRVKMSLVVTAYKNERTLSENKITYIDRNEETHDFLYPTFSRYLETKFGRGGFQVKDETFQNHYALIPLLKTDVASKRVAGLPDFGINFERKDKYLTKNEQAVIEHFMNGQIPRFILNELDLGEWQNTKKKKDSLVSFKVHLKSKAFHYLKGISRDRLKVALKKYYADNMKTDLLNPKDTGWENLKDTILIPGLVKKDQLGDIAKDLAQILKMANVDNDKMSKELIKLNDTRLFNQISVGFLISLLPKDKIKDFVYVSIHMYADDFTTIKKEYGELNNKDLYRQLDLIQSKISNRSYDLRVKEDDLREFDTNEYLD